MGMTAFVFPGQASQYVGMGRAVYDAFPDLRARFFARADEVLGFPISSLCFEGPEEELLKTENQQPAIFLVSCAICSVLRERGVTPDATAGHSLGEYSALVAVGALDFEDGLRLTRRRGELMAAIARRVGGIMAAVVGLDAARVDTICREAGGAGVVEVANRNSPSQTVISGEEPAVRRAMDLARDAGAKRVIQLAVSAPFHCSLMAPLHDEFGPSLTQVDIRDTVIPVVANVTADVEQGPDEIRRNLLEQLDHAVRWDESVRRLIGIGVDTVVEVGPKKVLSALMRQIDPSVTALSTDDPVGIESVVQRNSA